MHHIYSSFNHELIISITLVITFPLPAIAIANRNLPHLIHSKKEVFAETGVKTREEREADQFASDHLIPSTMYKSFIAKNIFTRESIIKFADDVGIDPGIVVGRLHHDKNSHGAAFKRGKGSFLSELII